MTCAQGWGETDDTVAPPPDFIGPEAARCLSRIFHGMAMHFAEGKTVEAFQMLAAVQKDLKQREKAHAPVCR